MVDCRLAHAQSTPATMTVSVKAANRRRTSKRCLWLLVVLTAAMVAVVEAADPAGAPLRRVGEKGTAVPIAAAAGREAEVVAAAAAQPNSCAWVFTVNEGSSLLSQLTPQWSDSACAGKYISVKALSYPSGFEVPNVHQLQVRFTPRVTAATSVYYAQAELSIKCSLYTPLCDSAVVYYVVRPYQPPTTTTTTPPPQPTSPAPTTTTQAPEEPSSGPSGNVTTTTTTTTLAPTHTSPAPVFCPQTTSSNAVAGVPAAFHVLEHVSGCTANLSIVILSTDPASAALFTVGLDRQTLWFDAKGQNTVSGFFTAVIGVRCGGASTVVCQITHTVVTAATLTPAPSAAPQACSQSFGFRTFYDQVMNLTIVPKSEDLASCPQTDPVTGAAFASKVTRFILHRAPMWNPQDFYLDGDGGTFRYHAPPGPAPRVDNFTFVIQCNGQDLCLGQANLIFVSPPETTAVPDESSSKDQDMECPGDFSFVYSLNEDGTFTASPRNLISASASSNITAPFCGGRDGVQEVRLETQPQYGSISFWNSSSGEFYYVPMMPYNETDWDAFTFTIVCKSGSDAATGDGSECGATAHLLVTLFTEPPQPSTAGPTTTSSPDGTVYHLGQITCGGTCDSEAWKSSPSAPDVFDVTRDSAGGWSHATPRPDGKATDGVEFSFSSNGNLLFRVYSTIGNMAARFPTFSPIAMDRVANITNGFLVAEAVRKGSHTGFERSCLDKQARVGLASSIWSWTDEAQLAGHLNYEEAKWAAGVNYFQKFGGKHRDCDTFRVDPCAYAPMYTPTMTDEVKWKLDIRGCYAVWTGEVSLSDMAKMKLPDGSPVFTVDASGASNNTSATTLTGTLYTQVIKPASWRPPYQGILTLHRVYTVTISTRSLAVTNLVVTYVGQPRHSAALATTTTKAAVSPTPTGHAHLRPEEYDEVLRSETGPATASPRAPDCNFSSDVSFSIGSDPVSSERLYNYTLRIYPFYSSSTGAAGAATAPFIPKTTSSAADLARYAGHVLQITQVSLVKVKWESPSKESCAACTGVYDSCEGSPGHGLHGVDHTGLANDCMEKALVSLKPVNTSTVHFSANGMSTLSVVSPSAGQTTSSRGSAHFDISLAARVLGAHSAHEVGQPEVSLALKVAFSNGQELTVKLVQEGYIVEVGVVSSLAGIATCRSSPYGPVADLFGTSLPVAPYAPTELDIARQETSAGSQRNTSTPADLDDLTKPYYGAPLPLITRAGSGTATCDGLQGADGTVPAKLVVLPSLAPVSVTSPSSVNGSAAEKQATLCAVPEAASFSTSDWVLLSANSLLPADGVSLRYVLLLVDAREALGDSSSTGRLGFVLHGNLSQATAEIAGMLSKDSVTDADEDSDDDDPIDGVRLFHNLSTSLLHWSTFAPGLSVRHVRTNSTKGASGGRPAGDPIQYVSFVPGAVLHGMSSARVVVDVVVSLSVPSSEPGSVQSASQRLAHVALPISKTPTPVIRADTDIIFPTLVFRPLPSTHASSSSKTGMVVAIVLLTITTAATIAAGVFFELRFKKIIDDCDVALKATGVSNVTVSSAASGEAPTSPKKRKTLPLPAKSCENEPATRAKASTTALPAAIIEKGLRTNFGVVREELRRVKDIEDQQVEVEILPRKDDEEAEF